jgi:MFS family permease
MTQAVFLPALNKKIDQLTLTLLSVTILALGLVALAGVGNLALLLIVSSVIAFGFGIQYVTVNTLISVNTPKDAQGGALGVAWAIAGLAQTIAPVLSTSLFSFGVSNGFSGLVFVVSAAISLLVLPLILAFRRTSSSLRTAEKV